MQQPISSLHVTVYSKNVRLAIVMQRKKIPNINTQLCLGSKRIQYVKILLITMR